MKPVVWEGTATCRFKSSGRRATLENGPERAKICRLWTLKVCLKPADVKIGVKDNYLANLIFMWNTRLRLLGPISLSLSNEHFHFVIDQVRPDTCS